jgi:uncharacterized membrane protein
MKQSFAVILALAMCIIAMPSAAAVGLDYYKADVAIIDDVNVENTIVLKFDAPVYHLDYQFDFRIYELTTDASFDSASCKLVDNGRYSDVSCDFVGMTAEKNMFVMKFRTKSSITRVDNKYLFAMNYPVALPTKKALIFIKLPDKGILSGDNVTESFSPVGGNLVSDGKKIMVYWDMSDLNAGETIQFSVLYDLPITDGSSLFNVIIVSFTMIIIFVMMGVTFYVKKSAGKSIKQTADIVSSVLNDDEKKVIDIVKNGGGEIIQRVIVREPTFSKAKVSRIIKNLRERNILDVIPLGRTNKVRMKIDLEKKEPPAGEANKSPETQI